MKDNEKKLSENLLAMIRKKEECDKKLLFLEILMGSLCVVPLITSTIIVGLVEMEEWLSTVIILTSLLPLLIATPFALRIEQTVGCYICKHCNYKYIPTYKSVFWAQHLGRTK